MRFAACSAAIAAVLLSLGAAPASAAPPPNDDFANATVLNVNGESELDFNTDATKQALEPNHAGNAGGASVWYSWTPQVDRLATVETCGGTLDTVAGVYRGNAVSNLTKVNSNDDGCPGEAPPGGGDPQEQYGSVVHFLAQGGTTYRIAVDGYNGAEGTIFLVLATEEPTTTPAETPTTEGLLAGIRARKNRRQVRLKPACDGGTYDGQLALARLTDNSRLISRPRPKGFRCEGGSAGFENFKLKRAWWRQAHRAAGLSLVATVERPASPPRASRFGSTVAAIGGRARGQGRGAGTARTGRI